jgi:protein-arginine kinase activator protein McsA
MPEQRGQLTGLWINGSPLDISSGLNKEIAKKELRLLSKKKLEKILENEIRAENYEFCAIVRDVLSERNAPQSK